MFVVAASCAVLAASAQPAAAQQTLNVSFGYFTVRGEEARRPLDILILEHHGLVFDINEFNSPTCGAEWLVPAGTFLEVGVGASLTRRTVSTVHRQFVSNGQDIERYLALRQIPVALTLRWLPLGQLYGVQPYAGAGLALVRWRYSESGDFVLSDRRIVTEEHVATGNAMGPLFVGGLRAAGDAVAFGFEARYQRTRGSFGPEFARLQSPEIDLSGLTLQGTAGIRF